MMATGSLEAVSAVRAAGNTDPGLLRDVNEDRFHLDLTRGLFMVVDGVGGQAASLPFSRKQESEADHIGLIYMARAGYDPHQAVAFWKRMLRASKGKEPPEFASDHPSTARRVEQVEGWLPEAERARQQR